MVKKSLHGSGALTVQSGLKGIWAANPLLGSHSFRWYKLQTDLGDLVGFSFWKRPLEGSWVNPVLDLGAPYGW